MRNAVFFTLFATSLLLGGCVSRTIENIHDHPTRPLTLVETKRVKTFLKMPISDKYEYWMCQDKGNRLICELMCDGERDVACPEVNFWNPARND